MHESSFPSFIEDQEEEEQNYEQLHEMVQGLYEEEERFLFDHMTSIQEHAELLTQEGNLLSSVQGENVVDYDIDAYASQLDAILRKKISSTQALMSKLKHFRKRLQEEENQSQKVQHVPSYNY